jgi:serine/threonine protein kinase
MIGTTLGHFRLESELGEGGMGVVYRARDLNLERDVALKLLPERALTNEEARLRFRREALALSRLNHPHIGAIYDFVSDGTNEFLVMELVPGQTLAERLKSGPLPSRSW